MPNIRRLAPREAVPDAAYLRERPPRYVLEQQGEIGAPLERVFAFFSDARNLAELTPPSLGFVIQTPTPIEMRAGATIDYRIKLNGIPLRWRTVIERWEAPHLFVDAQHRGPYRCWWHEHRFSEPRPGVTLMEDRVYYALPLGPLGRVAHAAVVSRQLRGIFDYRARAIEHVFPRAGTCPPTPEVAEVDRC